MATPEVNGGISRCGRVRKKTAKLMEMEESESPAPPPATADRQATRSPALSSTPQSSRLSSKKRPSKIKITIGGEEIVSDRSQVLEESIVTVLEPFDCEDVAACEDLPVTVPAPPVEPVKVVPALKIRLNSSRPLVPQEDGPHSNTHPVKRKGDETTREASERKQARKSSGHRSSTPQPLVATHNNHQPDLLPSNSNSVSNHSSDLAALGDAAGEELQPTLTPKSKGRKGSSSGSSNKKKADKSVEKKAKTSPESTVIKRPSVTAYTLWCKENRPKVQQANLNMDFAGVSKALGEIWQGLSNNEKLQWRLKAEKIKNGPVLMRDTGPPVTEAASARPPAAYHSSPVAAVRPQATQQHQSVKAAAVAVSKATPAAGKARASKPVTGLPTWQTTGRVAPVDVASYLRILGESLSTIGRRLADTRPQAADARTLAPLMDATVCALAPLLALTTLDPRLDGCDRETHCRTLDNLSYIMPGV